MPRVTLARRPDFHRCGTEITFRSCRSTNHEGSARDTTRFLVRSRIRRVTAAGAVPTLAGSAGSAGSTDGSGAAARVMSPSALNIGPAGDLFVIPGASGDTERKITAAVVVTVVVGGAGQRSAVGLGANPRLSDGLAVHGISSNRQRVTADNALLDIACHGRHRRTP